MNVQSKQKPAEKHEDEKFDKLTDKRCAQKFSS